MAKKVLILAYMFPPISDAGVIRPTAFAKYLPEYGWEPIVLTRPDSGKLPLDPQPLRDLPECVQIERLALGFEDGWKQHWRKRLGWLRPAEFLLGKPAGWLADGVAWRVAQQKPERTWEVAWQRPAVEACCEIVKRLQPDVLLATAPPFESLKVALQVHERTGIPFIADYRDPWTNRESLSSRGPRIASGDKQWERRVVDGSAKVVVVTNGMREMLAAMCPSAKGKLEVITNGFEELGNIGESKDRGDKMVVSHVGTMTRERWPTFLFDALELIQKQHPNIAKQLHVRFVGANNIGSQSLSEHVKKRGLEEIVEELGPVSLHASRECMRSSDVLCLYQPAGRYILTGKIFEYLAARRPILAMVLPDCDADRLLVESGVGKNAGVNDPDAVAAALCNYWELWRKDQLTVTTDEKWLGQFHRRNLTGKLADVMNEVTSA